MTTGTRHPEMAKTRLFTAVGDAVRKRRVSAGLTQAALAKSVGTSQATINKLEAGSQAPPLFVLVTLAEHFDCTLDDLVPVLTD